MEPSKIRRLADEMFLFWEEADEQAQPRIMVWQRALDKTADEIDRLREALRRSIRQYNLDEQAAEIDERTRALGSESAPVPEGEPE